MFWIPASRRLSMTSWVRSGVAAGASEAPMPRAVAARTSSWRSGRLSGSPPVNTTCGYGRPNFVISSSSA